ncbi:nucleoside triphosphate pyrophosphohydrolase [Peribacillus frigoritolerans]|jgi:tetrapyrrole methylase family protein/MazG family protein|uniref:nucleoside triphosphate pyrophosphohydrolase n=1 Tax=Peribacillus frigoritolerans TaxID=450367 RepID=UPI00223170A0|nr:nucleoside triphosphate pyrophosphohydrolase [Peribacillus frigoritolerans]MDM5311471.1 nucleoside triphosphate pyrophosphohydrolase [Peribacillus frigoritolerans]UZD47075.1 nucleoside triphosphate pyrophosphohydrolase [Peribacillus frigoritolerans]WHX62143.1 nucleoside triphosphate pyrophosphohydrolase [Peribacillus frigoritolerans]
MNEITIIGLGAGDLEQLPLGIYKKLVQMEQCYVRTADHPVIGDLKREGINFTAFDGIYEKHDQFEAVYEEIAETLLHEASNRSVLYAVPGHPMVAEKTVQLLLEKGPALGIAIKLEGGQSFLDPLFQAVRIDPIEGFQLLDGTDLSPDDLHITQHMIIGQVYDAFSASDVKLTLMEKLPDDYEVYIVTAAGSSQEKVTKCALFELDRQMELSNLTSVYVPPVKDEALRYREFSKLRRVIAELRGPDGCPWDKKQTHESLKKYLIEEAYELIDSIDEGDDEGMVGELGDVLLQVMLHSQIGEDEGMFTIDDVIEGITAKMIRRHPHVFGDVEVNGEEDVLVNWQKIKEDEKGGETKALKSILDGIEKSLPNLLRAEEYQKRAAKVGFDWDEVSEAWKKVREEVQELEEEILSPNRDVQRIKSELGDLFFALVNISRYYDIQAEEAVYKANQKFHQRFTYIEECIQRADKKFEDYTLEELDSYWDEAKAKGL